MDNAMPDDAPKPEPNAFEQAAQEERLPLWREFLLFLQEEKKWWLLPILIVLLLFGLLIFLAGTGLAPFIYTLF